jgi:hypothetical protein
MADNADADQLVAGQLRTGWLSQVYQISDIELQRRTWLDLTNQNPHWSYIEFVCSYPDDDQLSFAREHGWLSEREFDVLSKFRRILITYSPPQGNHHDNAAVLGDPGWQLVVEAAGRARQELLSITTDRLEREMLEGIRLN